MLNGHAQVVESDGHDVTQPCVLAAWLALKTAQSQGCRFAIMTDGSPTCGSQNVYDGASSGVKMPGEGVAAALLRQHGIENPRVLGSIPSPGTKFISTDLHGGPFLHSQPAEINTSAIP
ncbi:2-thiouracil desulfurase family protein [Enterobacter mori]